MAGVAELMILVKAQDQASKTVGGIGKTLGDVAKIAGGFVVAQGLLKLPGLLSSAVGSASDLSESMSKVNVVFGDQSQEIQDWAKTAAGAFGQSRQQALEAAGTYGNLFQAFGIGREESAKMSTSLVELAADLASFNNTPVDDALVALRSGLSGETEPLKRYGIAISDARMRTELAALGFKNLGATLTPLQKSTAAYALIMQDSALAQGDFARTSDGLANKQRILAARFKDVQAQIGQALIPVMLALGDFAIGRLVPALQSLFEIVSKVGGVFVDLARYIISTAREGDNLNDWLSNLPSFLRPVAKALGDVVVVFRDNLLPLFRAGLGGSTIGGEFSTLERAAFGLGQVFRNTLIPAWNDIKAAIDLFVLGFQGGEIGGTFSGLQQAAFDLGTFFRTELIPAMREVATFVVDTLAPAFVTGASTIVNTAGPVLREAAGIFKEDMLPAIKEVFDFIVENETVLITVIAAIGLAIFVALGPVSQAFIAITGFTLALGLFKDKWNEVKDTIEGGPIKAKFEVFGVDLSGASVPDFFNLRQHGGPVNRDRPYIVGEAGPEVFVPSTSGNIVPNAAIVGTGGITFPNAVFHFHGVQNVRQFMQEMQRETLSAAQAVGL